MYIKITWLLGKLNPDDLHLYIKPVILEKRDVRKIENVVNRTPEMRTPIHQSFYKLKILI